LIPIAKIAAPGLASRSKPKIVFRMFQEAGGRWRAESDDGMIGGAFFERGAAVRFVRRETTAMPVLVLHIAPEMDGLGNLRLLRSRPHT
jgi:hypothetical protein